MDSQREIIQEDLRGLVSGEVRCDDVFLNLYATDASIYRIKPLGVVRPRNAGDVVACVRYAGERRIAIHARGAGTGLAGESLGAGLVLDFSRHFRRVLYSDERVVRVQPGVVLERLNAHLAPRGRLFGPDPAMSHVTTMGSVAALDASGSRWLRYGSARRHVQSLEVVLADGTVMEAGREPLRGGVSSDPDPRKRDLINQLCELLSRYADLIQRSRPRAQVNRSGYHLWDVLSSDHLDLAKLLVGSEGTLALFTALTVATQTAPKHRAMALLFFDRLDSAARAVQEILPFSPSTCDLMDRRHLSLARETDRRYEPLIPHDAEAALIVEREGDDAVEVRDCLRQIIDRVRRRKRLAFDSRQAFSPEEIDLGWQLARHVVPTLYRLKGSTRAVPFVEDIAVPHDLLPKFLLDMQNVLKRHQVTASLFGHAGHGQLHIRPFLDLDDPAHVQIMERLAADLYDAVWSVGGTISGEHGDGLSRTPYLRRQYGELVDVFREVKRIFDPNGILNPGKVVAEAPMPITHNLRYASGDLGAAEPLAVEAPTNGKPIVELQLSWSAAQVADVARSCNGCGACRSQAADVRMCPIFRFAPEEEASPRAKANLMRAVLAGQLDGELVKTDAFKAVADLCVNCHQCRLECPAGVDIPKLMLEAKAEYVANNGLRPGDWFLTRLDWVASIGTLVSPFSNWVLGNRGARWVVEKVLGVARGRKLPRFAARSFIRRAERRGLTRPTRRGGRKVLFFVDTYANYFDTQLADALVAVFEHNGVAVYVHPGQTHSGMALVSLGAADRARAIAKRNIAILAEAVRQGYTIVTAEPSAALCLRHEYLALIDDEDAHLVADNTFEACTYLMSLHVAGKLQLDLKPIKAVLAYHMPCHLKALGVGSPGEQLLRLVPGLQIERLDKGCSGMAGTFGMKRVNYRKSLRAGWPLISSMRETTLQAGTTECSACKMQMEQGSSKPTIHPLKLLALAYGLMPEVRSLLTTRTRELVVT